MSGYRIVDEPVRSPLNAYVVNPLFPLFALMFAGAWLAWPWAVFNSFALGSYLRWQDLAIGMLGFIGGIAINAVLLLLIAAEAIPEGSIAYYIVVLMLFKLAVGYWLAANQQRSYELHQWYGGQTRNGLFIIAIGFVIRRSLPFSALLLWMY